MSEPRSTTHVWTGTDGWQLSIEDHETFVRLRFIHVDDGEHAFDLDLDSRRYETAKAILTPRYRKCLVAGEYLREVVDAMREPEP